MTRQVDRLRIKGMANDDRFTTQLLAAQRRMAVDIHALAPNLVEAEAILQNANTALLRKRAKAESVENFPAWILRVVYFEVLAFRKQRARDRQVFFPEDEVFDALATEGNDFRIGDLRRGLAPKNSPWAAGRYLLCNAYVSR